VPPRLPDRYSLEVRIGRDGDVEEWLATDIELDRPCLVRVLGPESTPERRTEFLDAVRTAAGISHLHLAHVYEAGDLDDGAFSVGEWPGGIRLSDRESADLSLDPATFLPNAEGLARALAALHERDEVHGAIDASAVFFPTARPAKLGAIGRHRRWSTPEGDTAALASVLEEALTGQPAGTYPPSQVIDGLSPALDAALQSTRLGRTNAKGLAELIASVPVAQPRPRPPGPSRRWLGLAVGLLIVAVALILLGSSLRPGPVSVPGEAATPGGITERSTTTTTSTVVGTIDAPAPRIESIEAFDPLGDGEERDEDLSNLLDGDPDTTWRTESYFDPLPLIKAGVGFQVRVTGSPSLLRMSGVSPGTELEVRWISEFDRSIDGWELVATARAIGTELLVDLPVRNDGIWLIWLVQVPVDDDVYRSTIAEIALT
jgi:hypothetical protein